MPFPIVILVRNGHIHVKVEHSLWTIITFSIAGRIHQHRVHSAASDCLRVSGQQSQPRDPEPVWPGDRISNKVGMHLSSWSHYDFFNNVIPLFYHGHNSGVF